MKIHIDMLATPSVRRVDSRGTPLLWKFSPGRGVIEPIDVVLNLHAFGHFYGQVPGLHFWLIWQLTADYSSLDMTPGVLEHAGSTF